MKTLLLILMFLNVFFGMLNLATSDPLLAVFNFAVGLFTYYHLFVWQD